MGLFGWIVVAIALFLLFKVFPILITILAAVFIGKWMDDVARR